VARIWTARCDSPTDFSSIASVNAGIGFVRVAGATTVHLRGPQLDELHLWVFPFIAGSGEPLLPGITTTHLDLAGVTEVGNGTVVLTYTPKR
jgi:hypothetical protein